MNIKISTYIKSIALVLALSSPGASAQEKPYQETRQVIYQATEAEGFHLLNPDEGLEQSYSLPSSDCPMRTRLRVVGGIQLPEPFSKRGEEMFRRMEYLLDDNLDSLIHGKDKYALYFKGEGEDFQRKTWNRIPGDLVKGKKLSLSIPVVKSNELKIAEGGTFGVELSVYFEKPGRAAMDVYDAPDTMICLPVPEGSAKRKVANMDIELPDNVACMLVGVGGSHFSGECWLEAPTIKANKNVVWHDPFVKSSERKDEMNYWVGCNLSDHSWPYWELTNNGKVIFSGKIFDRASNVADFYIPLPADIQPDGTLKLTLKKEPHRAAYPYELRSIELLQEPARDFEVIAVPKYVRKGDTFGILLETNKADQTITAVAGDALQPQSQTMKYSETGLHVMEFKALSCNSEIKVEISNGNRTQTVQVGQVVERTPGNVYLSVGDDIYIDKQHDVYTPYFKWYVGQRMGNWLQFRPSYQWSGVRNTKPGIVSYYTNLLNDMHIPYAWMVEGRTLAGDNINPSAEELASPMFQGKQAHENDGGYYYWVHFLYQGLFSDIAARHRPFGGIFAKQRPIYTDHGTYIHYDKEYVQDMAQGADYLVNHLRYSKGESTRHTGPSTMFRYFYQAGYDWLGAEQMYGPEETIMSSLRGASRAYAKPIYGSLHAMQWGSFPYTDPKHALRHYMSLAVGYMHGSSHLNTEDALWIDEYANDRYSESGKAHIAAQHKILDFIETHSRRGELYTRIAVLQGRNDSWKSFGRGPMWSQSGEKWKFGVANESFDLLQLFYPNNRMNSTPCNNWFTPTPYGPVDIVPIEANSELMKQYRLMLFLGWNTYDKMDFERIRDFVFSGGTLILTAAHINTNLQPTEAPTFPDDDAPIKDLLGEDYRNLTGKTERAYGLGKVIYFANKTYPADPEIREAYENAIKEQSALAISQEKAQGWIQTADAAADYTVWQDGDRRTFYVLNSDWKETKDAPFTFCYGTKTFDMTVTQGEMKTIHCADGLAVVPQGNTTDILDITPAKGGWNVRVQTTGADNVMFCQRESGQAETKEIKDAGIHAVFIPTSSR